MALYVLTVLQVLSILPLSYAVIDLRLTSFSIASPSTAVGSPYYQQGVGKTISSLVVTVVNEGDETLPAATSGMNYDIKLYLCELDAGGKCIVRTAIEVTSFDLNDGTNAKRGGVLLVSPAEEHFFSTGSYAILYPGSACPAHSHLCVKLINEGTYTDSNSANDESCLKFVLGVNDAGSTDCISDVTPVDLDITNQDPANMTVNSTIELTYTIQLKNAGGTAVPGGASNLGFEAFIANTDSDTASTIMNVDDSEHVIADVSTGMDEWGTTTYTGNQVTFNVPIETCSAYQYFCVKFVKGSSASYDDSDTNNLICIAFGDAASGLGDINCPITGTSAPVTTSGGVVTTEPLTSVANVTNATSSPAAETESGYVKMHIGVIAGIAIGCALVGAILVGLAFLAKTKLSKRAKVHDVAETGIKKGNIDKPVKNNDGKTGKSKTSKSKPTKRDDAKSKSKTNKDKSTKRDDAKSGKSKSSKDKPMKRDDAKSGKSKTNKDKPTKRDDAKSGKSKSHKDKPVEDDVGKTGKSKSSKDKATEDDVAKTGKSKLHTDKAPETTAGKSPEVPMNGEAKPVGSESPDRPPPVDQEPSEIGTEATLKDIELM